MPCTHKTKVADDRQPASSYARGTITKLPPSSPLYHIPTYPPLPPTTPMGITEDQQPPPSPPSSPPNPPTKIPKALYARINKTRLCLHHTRGSCDRLACRFAHSTDELRDRPDLTKTRLCPAYQQTGACLADGRCKYAHGEHELRATIEFYKTAICTSWKLTGTCRVGDSCRYAHGRAELRSRTDSGHGLRSSAKSATLPPTSIPPFYGQPFSRTNHRPQGLLRSYTMPAGTLPPATPPPASSSAVLSNRRANAVTGGTVTGGTVTGGTVTGGTVTAGNRTPNSSRRKNRGKTVTELSRGMNAAACSAEYGRSYRSRCNTATGVLPHRSGRPAGAADRRRVENCPTPQQQLNSSGLASPTAATTATPDRSMGVNGNTQVVPFSGGNNVPSRIPVSSEIATLDQSCPPSDLPVDDTGSRPSSLPAPSIPHTQTQQVPHFMIAGVGDGRSPTPSSSQSCPSTPSPTSSLHPSPSVLPIAPRLAIDLRSDAVTLPRGSDAVTLPRGSDAVTLPRGSVASETSLHSIALQMFPLASVYENEATAQFSDYDTQQSEGDCDDRRFPGGVGRTSSESARDESASSAREAVDLGLSQAKGAEDDGWSQRLGSSSSGSSGAIASENETSPGNSFGAESSGQEDLSSAAVAAVPMAAISGAPFEEEQVDEAKDTAGECRKSAAHQGRFIEGLTQSVETQNDHRARGQSSILRSASCGGMVHDSPLVPWGSYPYGRESANVKAVSFCSSCDHNALHSASSASGEMYYGASLSPHRYPQYYANSISLTTGSLPLPQTYSPSLAASPPTPMMSSCQAYGTLLAYCPSTSPPHKAPSYSSFSTAASIGAFGEMLPGRPMRSASADFLFEQLPPPYTTSPLCYISGNTIFASAQQTAGHSPGAGPMHHAIGTVPYQMVPYHSVAPFPTMPMQCTAMHNGYSPPTSATERPFSIYPTPTLSPFRASQTQV